MPDFVGRRDGSSCGPVPAREDGRLPEFARANRDSGARPARRLVAPKELRRPAKHLPKCDLATLDVRELAKRLEIDLTLEHAAYYLDDRSIGRIAEWITTFDSD